MWNNSNVIFILISISFLATLSTQIWPELIVKYWMSNYYFFQWEYFHTFIQFFSGVFIHGDFFHLIFNSLFIFIFWNYVSKIISERNLTLFFIFNCMFTWIIKIIFWSWIIIWMSWFALAILSYYWLYLYNHNNSEYKWAIFAIIINIAIWLTPWISLLGHISWVISWLAFYLLFTYFKLNSNKSII